MQEIKVKSRALILKIEAKVQEYLTLRNSNLKSFLD